MISVTVNYIIHCRYSIRGRNKLERNLSIRNFFFIPENESKPFLFLLDPSKHLEFIVVQLLTVTWQHIY